MKPRKKLKKLNKLLSCSAWLLQCISGDVATESLTSPTTETFDELIVELLKAKKQFEKLNK